MPKTGIGIDFGSDSIKVVAGRTRDGAFQVLNAGILRRAEGHGPEDVGPLLRSWKLKGQAIVGVTGRDMIIRYTQVPPMPDWRLKQVMGFEIADLSVQAGGDLSADFNRMDIPSSMSEDETILLTLIKNSLIQERTAALAGSKVDVSCFTPNAIALYNLLLKMGEGSEGTVMVVNIGADSMDMAIVRDGSLIFARNVSGGSNILNQALKDSFSFSEAKAEKLKKTMGRILVRDNAAGLNRQEEKIARSLSGAAGRIYSMIQSSLMFCKAQIKVADIELDRLLLTGGGTRLQGLTEYLAESLNVACDVLDPVPGVNALQLEGSEFERNGLEFSSAVGLAMMGVYSDVYLIEVVPEESRKKRSFQERAVFGIMAAVVLFVYLGMIFYLDQSDHDILDRGQRKIRSALGSRRTCTEEAKSLQEENSRLVEDLSFLEQKVIASTGLSRCLRLIQEHLPEDFWVTKISLDRVEQEELGTGREKKVVVRVTGQGKESDEDLTRAYMIFTEKLRAAESVSGVVAQASDTVAEFTFSMLVSFSKFPEPQGEEDDGMEENEG